MQAVWGTLRQSWGGARVFVDISPLFSCLSPRQTPTLKASGWAAGFNWAPVFKTRFSLVLGEGKGDLHNLLKRQQALRREGLADEFWMCFQGWNIGERTWGSGSRGAHQHGHGVWINSSFSPDGSRTVMPKYILYGKCGVIYFCYCWSKIIPSWNVTAELLDLEGHPEPYQRYVIK